MTTTSTTPRATVRKAVRDVGPTALGMVPFGLFMGVTIAGNPVGPALGLSSAALLYGGTAHLSAITMIAAGAGPPTVLAGVVAINARLLLYAAALQPRFAGQPRWFRLLGPALLIDQTFALATARPADVVGARFRHYWLTIGTVLGAVWVASHVVGVVAGPVLPAWLPLGVAAPAVLVGLLVPYLRTLTGIAAAVVAALLTAVATGLPVGVGTLAGALAGIVAGALVARFRAQVRR
jgi:predicted branched-subunit amino acid permease